MKKTLAVFARAHNYDPSSFDKNSIYFVDSGEDNAELIYQSAARNHLVNKNVFLLELTLSEDFDVQSLSSRAIDDTFRSFFPQFDVPWSELDDREEKEVDYRISSIDIIKSNVRNQDTEEDDDDSEEYENLDDLTEEEADLSDVNISI